MINKRVKMTMISNILLKLFQKKKKDTRPRDYEWERFQIVAKDQFRKLKEKGISIPVVTF